MKTILTIILAVVIFTAVVVLGWALSSVVIWAGLNYIGGFSLNFAQVVGLGFVLSLALSGVNSRQAS